MVKGNYSRKIQMYHREHASGKVYVEDSRCRMLEGCIEGKVASHENKITISIVAFGFIRIHYARQ